MTATPITVYYDGLCPLCSREIAHYRARATGAPVSFVDLTKPDFDPLQHGVDAGRAREILHVKVGQELRTGLNAAIAMWEVIPAYRWLGRLARLPVIYGLTNACYRVFARFRPYLQRHLRAADACRLQ